MRSSGYCLLLVKTAKHTPHTLCCAVYICCWIFSRVENFLGTSRYNMHGTWVCGRSQLCLVCTHAATTIDSPQNQSRSEPLSESEAMFYAACVVQGLDFLHQRGIAWRYVRSVVAWAHPCEPVQKCLQLLIQYGVISLAVLISLPYGAEI